MNQPGENATSSTPAGDQQQRGEAGASDQGRQHGKLVAALAVSSTTTGGSASRRRYALRHCARPSAAVSMGGPWLPPPLRSGSPPPGRAMRLAELPGGIAKYDINTRNASRFCS
jgi:hypothetical protein